MKKLLLLPIAFTITTVWGSPCTTAVGSAHVIATCALGDRPFSAFATIPGTTHMVGSGPDIRSENRVLVPPTEWAESVRGNTLLKVVDSATPDRADHGLRTAQIASAGRLPVEISYGGLEAVPLDSSLVLLDINGSTGKEGQLPTLIVPPDIGVEGTGTGPEKTPLISLDATNPEDYHFTEAPEPGTYAYIGLGLVSLWVIRRRRCKVSISIS